MIFQVLVVAQMIALVVAVPLLRLYIRERVINLAREASDKALADYQHRYDRLLASINADHQRQLQEFGLYTTKQHEVYGLLYRKCREASDRFAAIFGLSFGVDFAGFDHSAAVEYCTTRKVRDIESRPALDALKAGNQKEGVRLLGVLERRLNIRDAYNSFNRMKNIEALYELYLSDNVRAEIANVRQQLARCSVAARRDTDDTTIPAADVMAGAEAQVARLFHTMRQELGRGVIGPAKATQVAIASPPVVAISTVVP